MSNTTSRLALIQPVGTDDPDILRVSITANTNALDDAVTYTESTGAGLPGAGTVPKGALYRITDSGDWVLSNGTTWIHTGPIQTVTSLPGSSYDGQEINYVADSTNGVIWRFRYRAASGSAHKWEFVGSPDLVAEDTTSVTDTSSGTYIGGSTALNITLPAIAADYDVTIGGTVDLNAASSASYMVLSYKIGAVRPSTLTAGGCRATRPTGSHIPVRAPGARRGSLLALCSPASTRRPAPTVRPGLCVSFASSRSGSDDVPDGALRVVVPYAALHPEADEALCEHAPAGCVQDAAWKVIPSSDSPPPLMGSTL